VKRNSRVIITGATSGIGRALAGKFLQEGYRVGICGRRVERLRELELEYPGMVEILYQDLAQRDLIVAGLDELCDKLGGVDIFVANAGTSNRDADLPLEKELQVVDVNVAGFAASLNWAVHYFKTQGNGHIVGVSSVAAFWGNKYNPMYNATKAFEMNYLRGLREHLRGFGIAVTDIRPGFVATEMTANNPRMIFVASAEKAADQIYRAIKGRKKIVYITRRWRFISWIMRLTPDFIYRKLVELNKL
jgi:short-subunit dehydrogenase